MREARSSALRACGIVSASGTRARSEAAKGFARVRVPRRRESGRPDNGDPWGAVEPEDAAVSGARSDADPWGGIERSAQRERSGMRGFAKKPRIGGAGPRRVGAGIGR